MASGVGDGRVAIYWDFENLACSVGGGPADVGAIAAYAATFGTVAIGRAFRPPEVGGVGVNGFMA